MKLDLVQKKDRVETGSCTDVSLFCFVLFIM